MVKLVDFNLFGKNVKLEYTRQDGMDMIAQNAFANAVLAPLEVFVYKMDLQTSLDTRVMATLFSILGMSKVYANGQDKSRKFFGIELDKSSEKKINFHDSLYCGAFTLAYSSFLYTVIGDNSVGEIANNSFWNAVIAVPFGRIISYNMDSFRDFTGSCENPKLPNVIKNLSRKAKLGLAGSLLALYATSFSTSYDNFKNTEFNVPFKQSIENVIESVASELGVSEANAENNLKVKF